MKELLKGQMINPFSTTSSDLINITTGEKCKSLDLLGAKEKGLAALAQAKQKQSPKVASVHLQTFEEKIQRKAKAKQTRIYQEEAVSYIAYI